MKSYPLLLIALLGPFLMSLSANAQKSDCRSPIFCYGPILETIQLNRIFYDQKTFVDMPAKYKPFEIYQNFDALPDHNKDTLLQFVKDNFYDAYTDLYRTNPKDWKPEPEFLKKISNDKLKSVGDDVHRLWQNLTRMFNHSFSCSECFSSIESRYPFVVPGGRFDEYYYWDNLWILHGLIVSEMWDTALGVVYNLLDNIKEYGYMPNGARIYYSQRSQPPVCSLMFDILYKELMKRTPDLQQKALKLQDYAYPILKIEYEFWMRSRANTVEFQSKFYTLNHFNSNLTQPRPESYFQDYTLQLNHPERKPEELFRELGAGAESGLDYTARWFKDKQHFGTIRTSEINAVDLNVIMHKFEMVLAETALRKSQINEYQAYKQKAADRRKVMEGLMYDSQNGWWADYFYFEKDTQKEYYLSNFFPLWAWGEDISEGILNDILDSLEDQLHRYPGGMPQSLFNSLQQWDFPNVWPNAQFMVIEGLWRVNNTRAEGLAKKLSDLYVIQAYCGWLNSKDKETGSVMYEKYNAEFIGQPGGLGEYDVQTGFGWSNGVLLRILQRYGDSLVEPTCPPA